MNGRYFFDIHPPLGKLILTLGATLGNYDGSANFTKIGNPIDSDAFLWVRGAAALGGALIIPVAFLTSLAIASGSKVFIREWCRLLIRHSTEYG